MILVDTSVWVSHLRVGEPAFAERLERGEVMMHEFVLGELALGNLSGRGDVIADLANLPRAESATADELLEFIEALSLHGRGIGYVDAHLLAGALLSNAKLWTFDRRLAALAEELLLSPSSS